MGLTIHVSDTEVGKELASDGEIAAAVFNEIAYQLSDSGDRGGGLLRSRRFAREFVEALDNEGKEFLRYLAASVPEVEAP